MRRIAQAAITVLVATLVLTFVTGEQETRSQSPQEIVQRSLEALSNKESNWVQTWPGKGWFVNPATLTDMMDDSRKKDRMYLQ